MAALRVCVLFAVLLGVAGSVFAQTGQGGLPPQSAAALERIEQDLRGGVAAEATLSDWSRELMSIKTAGLECVQQAGRDVARVEQGLTGLGAPAEAPGGEAARERLTLEQEKRRFEETLAECRLLVVRSNEAQQHIAERQRALLAQRLLRRGPDFIAVLKTDFTQAPQWLGAATAHFLSHTGVEALSIGAWVILLLVLLVAARAGLRARRALREWAAPRAWDESFTDRFNHALVLTGARFASHVLIAAAAALFFHSQLGDVRPLPLLVVLAYGFLLYFVAWMLVRLLLVPPSPAALMLSMPPEVARALARRLNILLWLAFAGYLSFSSLLAPSLPESALLLARAVFAALVVLNLIWALWLIGRIPAFARTLWLRAVLWLALAAGLAAELAGYRELSLMVWRVVLGSVAAIGVLYLASRLFR